MMALLQLGDKLVDRKEHAKTSGGSFIFWLVFSIGYQE